MVYSIITPYRIADPMTCLNTSQQCMAIILYSNIPQQCNGIFSIGKNVFQGFVKVEVFWEGHKNLMKSPATQRGWFCQILWHTLNIWTLVNWCLFHRLSLNSIDETYFWDNPRNQGWIHNVKCFQHQRNSSKEFWFDLQDF